MPPVHRLGDLVSPHSCPPYGSGSAPSTVAATGSPNVLVNGKPCVRMTDITAVHPCVWPDGSNPHVGTYIGVRTVLANGLSVQVVGDPTSCTSICVVGSGNVMAG